MTSYRNYFSPNKKQKYFVKESKAEKGDKIILRY